MSKDFELLREKMVETQLKSRGIRSRAVLDAMRSIPRHEFVPEDLKNSAYRDEPLPIGEGQTISQPFIVAYMTEALNLTGREEVLEIGTGSGYQSAVLASLVEKLYTIELLESLSQRARSVLEKQGYDNIVFKVGDGSRGLAECAPFDAIMVTAAPAHMPAMLKDQLKPGGRLVIPVGETFQELILVKRKNKTFETKKLLPVRFVPLISTH